MLTFSRQFVISVLCLSLFSGCATQSDYQELAGGGIGAVLGAGVAALAGGDVKTIVAAGVGGAIAGRGVAKVIDCRSNKTRSVNRDNEIYGLSESAKTSLVKIRRGSSFPEMVRPGEFVNIVTDYSVIAPEGAKSVNVEESWLLKKDGVVLAVLDPKNHQRSPGGWTSKAQIQIPQGAGSGTYLIEHKVQSGTSYDVDQSVFVVR